MKALLVVIVIAVAAVFAINQFAPGVSEEIPPEEEPMVEEPVVVTNFEECVAAGNPVMESFPRQCAHDGETFVESVVDDFKPDESGAVVTCTDEQRDVFCTQQYEPVCGLTQVECITTPCDPVPQAYGNACTACSNPRVISYTQGVCPL